MKQRSNCPISCALDIIGDRWTLLIIRDMMLHKKQNYQDFLVSEEKISTNILADRLKRLTKSGIIQKELDTNNKKKFNYSLTPMGLDLMPVLVSIATWSSKHIINSPKIETTLKAISKKA